MLPNELLNQAKLDDALKALQDQIRADPANPKHRIFLFQLLCVMGKWDKALTQLNVASDLDPKAIPMKQVCQQTLQCEVLRAEVYAGKRTPLVFGEPNEWVAWLLQSLQYFANGTYPQALALRDKAFEAAPAVSGKIDGVAFQWLADADSRMGPILEAIIDGKYFWVPLINIKKIKIEPPADLRDIIWLPVTFEWANGGSGVGLIPGRYPGSESHHDPSVKLARKTLFENLADGVDVPLGQRLLATDAGEYPILDVRSISFGE
jgi:type VI secretion system protein ImpE